jgi:hypothetical protein
MTFAIWYKVEIAEAAPSAAPAPQTGLRLPLTVSNDAHAGSYVVDAEITVSMSDGASADTFTITLINLPIQLTELIRAVQATRPVNVSVHLGYFDQPSTTTTGAGHVLVGRITSVTGSVCEDGFARTTLSGQEQAGYLLRNTPAALGRAHTTKALEFAAALAKVARVEVAGGSTLTGDLANFTVRQGSTLEVLRTLARQASAPLVIRDGKVYLGASVGALTEAAPTDFDPATNVVALDSTNAEDTTLRSTPPVRDTLSLTVLGHPGLRVGQVAKVTGLSGVPTGSLRLSRVVHRFTTTGGYTAEVGLIAAGAGQQAQVAGGVQAVVDRWRETLYQAHDDHPAIDLGRVKEYTAGVHGHLATLRYADGPDPADPDTATVDLYDKPISSPFAFGQSGLVVPVYPKMRALLAHNRGQVNDAVVAGFVWPDDPDAQRPPNRTGDYWLALPTKLGEDGLPLGPGANDLTDAGGHRVVQAAGLHIQVGTDSLPDVGTRPDPPTDASITIEHQSGTTITIDPSGAVAITTQQRAITLTNGAVSLALDGAGVAVS